MVMGILALIVSAAPPSFDNHQFYGTVTWDIAAAAPAKVSAVSGLSSAESAIENSSCNTESCIGTYGTDTDNILRISGGKDGDVIIFSIEKVNVINSTYQSGSVTELNFNLVTAKPAPKVEETPKINDTENVTVTAVNATNVSVQNDTASLILGDCTQQWSCSPWSTCSNNVQTRSCTRADDCDVQLEQGSVASIIEVPKLPESQGCISPVASKPAPVPPKPAPKATQPAENCSDKIKNQDETDVDCGGKCKACAKADSAVRWYYVGGGVVVAIIIVLLLFLRRGPKLDENTLGRLRSAYSGGENRGMSDEQITEKLIESGWDEKSLKAFLRRK